MARFETTTRARRYRRYLGMALGKPLAGPLHVSLETTHHCNLRCSFCESHGILQALPITSRREYIGRKMKMDLETVQRLAGELAEVGADLVELSGKGDPIAHPQLTDIVRAIKDAGLTCALVTNGTLAKPDLAPTLIEKGLDRLNVSLNAGTREVYLRSNHKDLWDKAIGFLTSVLEGRKQAGTKRPWVRISHVVTKENIDDMDNMAQICVDLGIDQVDYYVMGELPETPHIQLDAVDVKTIHQGIGAWSKRLDDAGIVHDLPIFLQNIETRLRDGESQENPLQKKVPCYVGWNFVVIAPDGEVVPCCYCEDTVLGNITATSFVDVWHGHLYKQFRKDSLDMPKKQRYICEECYTTCNRGVENFNIYNKLHPFNPAPATVDEDTPVAETPRKSVGE